MKHIFAPLIMSILCVSITPAQSTQASQDSLRGIKSLHVVVEEIPADVASQTSVTTQQIQTDVELRLRRSSIIVTTEKPDAILVVVVNPIPVQQTDGRLVGIIAFSANIWMEQWIRTEKNPKNVFLAPTWRTSATSYTSTTLFSQMCRDRVLPDLLDRFINDYLAANPKTP